ncbi:hypothetical protein AFCA_009527 [Aspergillus flavus]|nr:hypothetical protein AFCA_009527 [Aspergillus flavus]
MSTSNAENKSRKNLHRTYSIPSSLFPSPRSRPIPDRDCSNAQFVKCNITSWEEQVSVFEAAIANSPSKSCDIVIANAGISRASGDSLWPLDGKGIILTEVDINAAPVKPDLKIVDVNLTGTLYTWKLAVHYFRKQPDTEERDRCFIITGSMVAWIDSPVRGLVLLFLYQKVD